MVLTFFKELMSRPKIILLGDSITQLSFASDHGFGAALCDAYQRRADVFNRGYSGYNVRQSSRFIESDHVCIVTRSFLVVGVALVYQSKCHPFRVK